jgi:hypothetical protein
MNRLHQLKQTLEVNIQQNVDYEMVEFVLLDYNSQDGLERYIQSRFMNWIETGLLVYYKTPLPVYFNRSHSRNMAFKLASGEILCNLDADNFTGEGFAHYINNIFDTDCPMALNVLNVPAAGPDVTGRICLRKKDFLELNGYDERLEGYGYEDNDLINRLELSGIRFQKISNPAFLKYIPHSDQERIQNERMIQMLHEAWIQYIDPATSKIFLFNKDSSFKSATIIHNYTRYCADMESFLEGKTFSGYKLSFEKTDWEKGSWQVKNDSIHLAYNNSTTVFKRQEDTNRKLNQDGSACFYPLTKEKLVRELVFFCSQIENRSKMTENLLQKRIQVNDQGFGRGIVYKNFSTTPLVL